MDRSEGAEHDARPQVVVEMERNGHAGPNEQAEERLTERGTEDRPKIGHGLGEGAREPRDVEGGPGCPRRPRRSDEKCGGRAVRDASPIGSEDALEHGADDLLERLARPRAVLMRRLRGRRCPDLTDTSALGHRARGEPDIDPFAGERVVPERGLARARRERSGTCELRGDRIPQPSVERGAHERSHELSDERALPGRASAHRLDEVEGLVEDGPSEGRDGVRRELASVGVDDDDGASSDEVRRRKQQTQAVPAARDAVVRGADAVDGAERMGGDHERAAVAMNAADDLRRPVARPAVGVEQEAALSRERSREGGDDGLHDTGNGRRVVERGDADENVYLSSGHQRANEVVGEQRGPRASRRGGSGHRPRQNHLSLNQ